MTGCLERVWYHATDWKEHHPERPPKWVVTANEGVPVYAKCSKTSEKLGQLSEGANFQEVSRDGGRIQFKKISGDGPEEGWLSWYVAGKKAAKRCNNLRWFKDVGKVRSLAMVTIGYYGFVFVGPRLDPPLKAPTSRVGDFGFARHLRSLPRQG